MRVLVLAILVVSCVCKGPPQAKVPISKPGPPSGQARTKALAMSDPAYARLEGSEFANDCKEDAACYVGGCGGEVCSAEEGVMSTCEIAAPPPKEASCGCVGGQCLWYRQN